MKNIKVKKLTKEEFEDFILMKKIEDTSLEEITELLLNQSYLVMFWQQAYEQRKEQIERLNNIIEKTESMLKRLMEEQEYCYKKYPENWKERKGVSNTWLTSRDCYWSALNYLKKLKGSDKE